MTSPAVLVAIAFGFGMGWALGGPAYPRLATTVALLAGAAAGAVILATSYGTTPDLAGGSLLLGSGTALAAGQLRRRGRGATLPRKRS